MARGIVRARGGNRPATRRALSGDAHRRARARSRRRRAGHFYVHHRAHCCGGRGRGFVPPNRCDTASGRGSRSGGRRVREHALQAGPGLEPSRPIRVQSVSASPMSALLRPFQKEPTPLATVVTALGVGIVGARIDLTLSGVRLGEPRVLLLLLSFTMAAAGVVLAASALTWGARSNALAPARIGLASSIMLAWVSVDSLHYNVFQRHVDEQAIALGWEAVRSKALRLGPSDLVALGVAIP